MTIKLGNQLLVRVQEEMAHNISNIKTQLMEWLERPESGGVELINGKLHEIGGSLSLLAQSKAAQLTEVLIQTVQFLQNELEGERLSADRSEFIDMGADLAAGVLILSDFVERLGHLRPVDHEAVETARVSLLGVIENKGTHIASKRPQIGRETYQAIALRIGEVIEHSRNQIDQHVRNPNKALNHALLIEHNRNLSSLFLLLDLPAPQILLKKINEMLAEGQLNEAQWIDVAEGMILVEEALKTRLDINPVAGKNLDEALGKQTLHSRHLEVDGVVVHTGTMARAYFQQICKDAVHYERITRQQNWEEGAFFLSQYASVFELVGLRDLAKALQRMGLCYAELSLHQDEAMKAVYAPVIDSLVAMELIFNDLVEAAQTSPQAIEFLDQAAQAFNQKIKISPAAQKLFASFAQRVVDNEEHVDAHPQEFDDVLSSLDALDEYYQSLDEEESASEEESALPMVQLAQTTVTADAASAQVSTVQTQISNSGEGSRITQEVIQQVVHSADSVSQVTETAAKTQPSAVQEHEEEALPSLNSSDIDAPLSLDDFDFGEAEALPEPSSHRHYAPSYFEAKSLDDLDAMSVPHEKKDFLNSRAEAVVDEEIREFFIEEFNEIVEQIKALYPDWRHDFESENTGDIRRAFHTLKGSGRTVGYEALGEFAWQHERLLNGVIEHVYPANDLVREVIGDALSLLVKLQHPDTFTEAKAALLWQALVAERTRNAVANEPDSSQERQQQLGAQLRLGEHSFLPEALDHVAAEVADNEVLLDEVLNTEALPEPAVETLAEETPAETALSFDDFQSEALAETAPEHAQPEDGAALETQDDFSFSFDDVKAAAATENVKHEEALDVKAAANIDFGAEHTGMAAAEALTEIALKAQPEQTEVTDKKEEFSFSFDDFKMEETTPSGEALDALLDQAWASHGDVNVNAAASTATAPAALGEDNYQAILEALRLSAEHIQDDEEVRKTLSAVIGSRWEEKEALQNADLRAEIATRLSEDLQHRPDYQTIEQLFTTAAQQMERYDYAAPMSIAEQRQAPAVETAKHDLQADDYQRMASTLRTAMTAGDLDASMQEALAATIARRWGERESLQDDALRQQVVNHLSDALGKQHESLLSQILERAMTQTSVAEQALQQVLAQAEQSEDLPLGISEQAYQRVASTLRRTLSNSIDDESMQMALAESVRRQIDPVTPEKLEALQVALTHLFEKEGKGDAQSALSAVFSHIQHKEKAPKKEALADTSVMAEALQTPVQDDFSFSFDDTHEAVSKSEEVVDFKQKANFEFTPESTGMASAEALAEAQAAGLSSEEIVDFKQKANFEFTPESTGMVNAEALAEAQTAGLSSEEVVDFKQKANFEFTPESTGMVNAEALAEAQTAGLSSEEVVDFKQKANFEFTPESTGMASADELPEDLSQAQIIDVPRTVTGTFTPENTGMSTAKMLPDDLSTAFNDFVSQSQAPQGFGDGIADRLNQELANISAASLSDTPAASASTSSISGRNAVFLRAVDRFENLSQMVENEQRPELIDDLLDAVYDIEDSIDSSTAPHWVWHVLDSIEQMLLNYKHKGEVLTLGVSSLLRQSANLIETYQDQGDEEEALETISALMNSARKDEKRVEKESFAPSVSIDALGIEPDPNAGSILAQTFLDEAMMLFGRSQAKAEAWDENREQLSHLDAIRRDMHTLKGSARMAGYLAIGDLAHSVESLIENIVDGYVDANPHAAAVLAGAMWQGSLMLDNIRDGYLPVPEPNILNNIHACLNQPLPYPEVAAAAEEQKQQAKQALAAEEALAVASEEAVSPVAVTPSASAEVTAEAEVAEEKHFAENIDPVLVEIFTDEAQELLEATSQLLKQSLEDSKVIHELQRTMHTLKGGARLVGFMMIGDLAHLMESVIEHIPHVSKSQVKGAQQLLVLGLETQYTMLDSVLRGEMPEISQRVNDALRLFAETGQVHKPEQKEEALESSPAPAEPIAEPVPETVSEALSQPEAPAPVPETPVEPEVSEALPEPKEASVEPVQESPAPKVEEAPNPFSAKEMAKKEEHKPQNQPATDLSRFVRVDADLLDEMIAMLGESAIMRSRMENVTSDSEYNLNELTRVAVRIAEQVRRLDNETEAQMLSRRDHVLNQDDEHFDPLEMDRFSELQQLSRQLSEAIDDLKNIQETLNQDNVILRNLTLQQGVVQRDLQERLLATQLMRFDIHEPRLKRLIRQTALSVGKDIQFILEGGEVELERRLLEDLLPSLEHMIRNSIAHGIELPETRRLAGKTETGTIKVAVSIRASEISVRIIDDGAGIDYDKIREKAKAKGILDPERVNDEQYLNGLMMRSGFSTAENLSQLSGRGVGMDVVHEMLKQRRGQIQAYSLRGKGTEFDITMPFSMSIAEVLLVEIAGQTFAAPMSSIAAVSQIEFDELSRSFNNEIMFHRYHDTDYRIYALGQYFKPDQYELSHDGSRPPVLLINIGSEAVAFHVDKILNRMEIIVKNVNRQVLNIPGISGATILGDGRVVPVLELLDLSRRLTEMNLQRGESASVEEVAKNILVVDDSVTMRKVSTRLLERNHYNVATAKDGLDAIEVLETFTPDLIMLDIEMPRMDGFEFAAHVRQSAAEHLRQVPIVMITSRTGDKHRERADQIGVQGYLGKPYREDVLLETLTQLLQK